MIHDPESVKTLLKQIVANQEVLALAVSQLKEEFAVLRAEMKSNYVGYEAWAKEFYSNSNH